MLKYLNYERLKNITKTVKPYRGSTNRFPIGSRTQNTKFFLVENDETGEEVYRIVYGYCHNSEEITKEEYDAAKSAGDKDVSEYTWYNPVQYKRHTKIPHQLGIVRSDNTFEFNNTNGYYGQGSNMLLSRWSAGYFYSSSRHGGMVYRERRTNADGFGQHYLFHPIFDGMRIHIESGEVHESSQYRVVGSRVSRKDSKEFLSRYSTFYKVAEVMMKTMDYYTLLTTANDIVHEATGKSVKDLGYWPSEDFAKELRLKADDLVDSAPLDAALLYCVGLKLYRGDLWRTMQRVADGQTPWTDKDSSDVFVNLKRNLNRHLFEVNPECMKQVEFESGKQYPQSDWNYEIYVTNNKTGVQYRARQFS